MKKQITYSQWNTMLYLDTNNCLFILTLLLLNVKIEILSIYVIINNDRNLEF